MTRDNYLMKSPCDFTVFHIFSTLLKSDFYLKVFGFPSAGGKENKQLITAFFFSLKNTYIKPTSFDDDCK